MATKRELMLTGFAAKAAHMLASDVPVIVAPAGSTLLDATLLETNLNLVQGVAGDTAAIRGVRLHPASGQFIHVIRNTGPNTINVWPHSTDWFNDRAPGASWAISPASTGFFIPARQQWLVGNMLGEAGRALTIPGPLVIGGALPPTDATDGDLFVSDVLCVALGLRGSQGPPPSGRMTFNAYFDNTPAGTWHYLGNGPALQWRFDGVTGQLALHTTPSGLAGQAIPSWDPIPQNPIAVFGPNAVSLGTPPPSDVAASSLFANYLNVPWSSGAGGDGARVNFNCYFDGGLVLRYAATGPAYRIVFPSAGASGMHVRSAPSGAAGAPLAPVTEFFAALAADQLSPGQTNILLTTNEAGTVVYQQVLVGPAGSGPAGSGRALYVAT
jgi:hypothetical protein